MDCSTRTLTEGAAIVPRFVLIIMTPFAPRTPYIALAEASFKTEKDSISAGSRSFKLRSTPSTNTNGEVFPLKEAMPRIQKFELSYPGSPDGCTAITPAKCPAKLLLSEREDPTCNLVGSIVCTEPITESFF